MPNMKKLVISCRTRNLRTPNEQFAYLANLHQLETLKITLDDLYDSTNLVESELAFSKNLRNLPLRGCQIPWESMTVFGALPELEVLKLKRNACLCGIGEPIEGDFCQLKVLLIKDRSWAFGTHFPQLERLIIRWCRQLQDIHCGMGDIPTLEQIELVDCHPSVEASAVQIQEEQQRNGNEYLKIYIDNAKMRWRRDDASINLQLESFDCEPDEVNLEDLGTWRSRRRHLKRRYANKKEDIFYFLLFSSFLR